ncbi:sodium-dependent glucose transporter 1A-like [Mus pahari]|uniref:sodium-dependent glucose transporter 1A-like n=1 Tax=Mus pahari TaxID=10093 RepID=UPI000A30C463|nr:sodium-dependent glucose transporter 1A-like [Mus pahari]
MSFAFGTWNVVPDRNLVEVLLLFLRPSSASSCTPFNAAFDGSLPSWPQQETEALLCCSPGVAKLELEVEFRRFGAAAAGQRLLQTETPAQNDQKVVAFRRSVRARNVLRWFSTTVLYAAFLGLGMTVAILGPTFPDLARSVNQNISSLSDIFVGRALGYFCGSVVGGVLFDCMNHFLLLGMSMLATTIGLYLIPFCKTATLLIAMMSVFGVSFGALDTGANVLILDLWGDKGAPHMQALHFSFALGAFLAPLLAKLAWGTPGTMIVLSNIGSLASCFFLVLFDKSPLCLWIATSVYGASMATTFPSGVSWIEQYTTLTGKSAAFFVIGGTVGEMAIPAVIGILQGHYPDLPAVFLGIGTIVSPIRQGSTSQSEKHLGNQSNTLTVDTLTVDTLTVDTLTVDTLTADTDGGHSDGGH